MKKILEVDHLSKIYHTKREEILALEDINFSIYEGEFISIIGPSGCGKSTILSILSDLLTPSSGGISLYHNYKIAYMPQKDSLLSFRTVLDNCLLGLKLTNQLTDENKNYVLKLLKDYGLEEFIHQYPKNLSGGMRQRCALIRTLALKPDILLLDEAMSSLDYQSRLAIGDDLYQIIKKEGKTAIMVTHDIGEAISMSDRVIVLTKRPASVKKIYKIEFQNRSTPIQNRNDPNFLIYFDEIWRDLDVQL